jgi:hypothetical protein
MVARLLRTALLPMVTIYAAKGVEVMQGVPFWAATFFAGLLVFLLVASTAREVSGQ